MADNYKQLTHTAEEIDKAVDLANANATEVYALKNYAIVGIQGKLNDLEKNKADAETVEELKKDIDNLDKETENKYTKSEVDEKLNDKVEKAEGKGLSTNDFDNKYKSKVDDTYSKSEVDSKFKDKVDKVEGKGLSTNDFTDEYKNKVDNAYTKAETDSVVKAAIDIVNVDTIDSYDISSEIDHIIDSGKILYFPEGTTKKINYEKSSKIKYAIGTGRIHTREDDEVAPDIYEMPVQNIGDNIQTDMNYWSDADSRLIYPHSKFSGFLWDRNLWDLNNYDYITPWMTFTTDKDYQYPDGYEPPENTIINIKKFIVVGYDKVKNQLVHLFDIGISNGSTRDFTTNEGEENVKPVQNSDYQTYTISSNKIANCYLHCWGGMISYINGTARFPNIEYVGIMCEVSTNRLGIIAHIGLDQKTDSDIQEVGGSRFKHVSHYGTKLWFSNCPNDENTYKALQEKLELEANSKNHAIEDLKRVNNQRNIAINSSSEKVKTFTLSANSLYYVYVTPVSSDGSMDNDGNSISALVYTNSKQSSIQVIKAGNGNSTITADGLTITTTTITDWCLHAVIQLSAISV